MEDAAVTHDSLVLPLASHESPRVPDTMPDVTALYAVSACLVLRSCRWFTASLGVAAVCPDTVASIFRKCMHGVSSQAEHMLAQYALPASTHLTGC
jgi:hypothetical protein